MGWPRDVNGKWLSLYCRNFFRSQQHFDRIEVTLRRLQLGQWPLTSFYLPYLRGSFQYYELGEVTVMVVMLGGGGGLTRPQADLRKGWCTKRAAWQGVVITPLVLYQGRAVSTLAQPYSVTSGCLIVQFNRWLEAGKRNQSIITSRSRILLMQIQQ